jgi:hypothetical protein
MKKLIALALVFCFVATAFPLAFDDGDSRELFEFHRLTPVVAPFTGNTNPIRNLGGGGIPWKIQAGRAELNSKGRLEVYVRGLVLAAGPNAGTNPVANFAAILSCQSVDTSVNPPAPLVLNLVAGIAPATAAGDADIEGKVNLPSPCIAPIVFVAIPATNAAPARWLAASGF